MKRERRESEGRREWEMRECHTGVPLQVSPLLPPDLIVFGFLPRRRTDAAGAMATTLTRSTSGDTLCRGGRPCRRSRELRRSDSFLRELRPWVPKCPTGVDSEWQLLGGLPRRKLPRS